MKYSHGLSPLRCVAILGQHCVYQSARLGRNFYGVSQNVERELDPLVMHALNAALRELGASAPPFHGMCAEPVAISKAIRFYKQGGASISLAGSICRAYEIPLTGGTLNPSTATFQTKGSFGDRKPACDSCRTILRLLNITEG